MMTVYLMSSTDRQSTVAIWNFKWWNCMTI